jgi:DNA-binding response OmpR family regulator
VTPRRLLFVEDEPALRHAYQRYFGGTYDLAFAGTGAEGLAEFESFNPDIVVLDMQLPDTDGLALLNKLREQRPTLPVIITTAYESLQPVIRMMGLGHSGYLVKPFELGQLAALIEAVKDQA